MTYKHLIFDYDGTVGDSYPVFNDCLQQVLRLHGIEDDPADTMKLLKKSFGTVFNHYNERIPAAQLRAEFVQARSAVMAERLSLCAGMQQLLDAAREVGAKCYIYTHSGREVERYLQKMGVREDFVDLMTAAEGYPTKPDPTALLTLCARNEIALNEALMIGDRHIDVAVGHNAGMHGCLFDPDGFYDASEVGAEYNVKSLDELIPLIF
ncbi:MAG: HAD-IA family hydrolase [Clostridia bacterium]|nr:HAD-IA family hydrolase [Clostridia bacterium]